MNDIESIPVTFVNFTFIFFCFSQILKNGLRFENGAEITYESHDDITKKPGTKAFNSFRFHALSTNITNLGNLENLIECRFSDFDLMTQLCCNFLHRSCDGTLVEVFGRFQRAVKISLIFSGVSSWHP